MSEYDVSYTETTYYLTKRIQAKTEKEAREKFTEMLEGGNVEVNKTDLQDLRVEEIK